MGKRFLSTEKICQLAADPTRCTRSVPIQAIDFSRPFIPEHYTQLYYTPIYARLSFEQRLVYNQLFGVRTNEFIMMLERDLIEHILRPLRNHRRVRTQSGLAQCVDIMIAEERRHYGFFLELNRRSLPEVYTGGRERYFSQLPWGAGASFYLVGLLARRFAFPLWYLMAMEESSITLSRAMNRQTVTESLGELEPHWVAVHREHAKDEARHLHIDAHLIEQCIGSSGNLTQRIDAGLFQRLLKGGLGRPERSGSGVKVVHQLVKRCPELQPREQEMIAALLELKDHKAFLKSLFSRDIMPLTFGIFDDTPALADLPKHLVGYERH